MYSDVHFFDVAAAPKSPHKQLINLTIFLCQFVSRHSFDSLSFGGFALSFIVCFCSFQFCTKHEKLHMNTLSLSLYALVHHLFQIVQLNIHTQCSCSRKRATTKTKPTHTHKMTTYVSFRKWMKSHNEFDIFCKKNIMKNGIQIDWKTAAAVVCLCDIYNGMC